MHLLGSYDISSSFFGPSSLGSLRPTFRSVARLFLLVRFDLDHPTLAGNRVTSSALQMGAL
jgi:hypothetical protein